MCINMYNINIINFNIRFILLNYSFVNENKKLHFISCKTNLFSQNFVSVDGLS